MTVIELWNVDGARVWFRIAVTDRQHLAKASIIGEAMMIKWTYLVCAMFALGGPCNAQNFLEAAVPENGKAPPPFIQNSAPLPPPPPRQISDSEVDELLQEKKDFLRNDAPKALQI